MMKRHKIQIEDYAEGAILLDGLEGAILGVAEEFGSAGGRILYSKPRILKILQDRDGMTLSEAIEFYEFNILGMWVSDQNPIFLDMEIEVERHGGDWEFFMKEE